MKCCCRNTISCRDCIFLMFFYFFFTKKKPVLACFLSLGNVWQNSNGKVGVKVKVM